MKTEKQIEKIARKAYDDGIEVIVSNEAKTGRINLYRVYENRIRRVEHFPNMDAFMVWHNNRQPHDLDWKYMFVPYI